MDFSINVADAAIGLRRASKNKEMWTKNTVFYGWRARKKRFIVRVFFLNARTYEYYSSMEEQLKNTWPQYESKQTQQPGTKFSKYIDKVAVSGGHENCCRFATQ